MPRMTRRSVDVVLLFVLLMARVRIDTLADLVLPARHEDLLKLPWIGRLFSPQALSLLKDWLTDPLSLVLISLAFAVFVTYVAVDLLRSRLGEKRTYALKMAFVLAIIGLTVVAGSLKLIALRHATGPAAYSHDGGVIQTEEAAKLFLAGRNPYVEDYTNTPLAEWGIDFHSAVYHYPYLPWTFIFSAPFLALSRATLGWFDERMIYLALFVLTLVMALRLAPHPTARLALVMLWGLNPIMGSDVIFGQNDSFVLFWLALALWLLPRAGEGAPEWRVWLSAGAAGLACASKPTAWFAMPFYLAALLEARWSAGRLTLSPRWLTRLAPLAVVILLLIGPYLVWNAPAMIEDVWSWAAGTSPAPYQIRGWGFSNFVLALGLVPSRLSYFPFWIPELLAGLPVLILLLARQLRRADYAAAGAIGWNGAILLFVYAFFSRFFNENYVGFIAALLALGLLADWPAPAKMQPASAAEG